MRYPPTLELFDIRNHTSDIEFVNAIGTLTSSHVKDRQIKKIKAQRVILKNHSNAETK